MQIQVNVVPYVRTFFFHLLFLGVDSSSFFSCVVNNVHYQLLERVIYL